MNAATAHKRSKHTWPWVHWRALSFLILLLITALLIYFSYRTAQHTRTLAVDSATAVAEEVSDLLQVRSMLAAEEKLVEVMEQKSLQIRVALERAISVTNTLAAVFAGMQTAGIVVDVGRDSVNQVLSTILAGHPDFFASYTVWEPDAFDLLDLAFIDAPGHDQTGRFIPYWYRTLGATLHHTATQGYTQAAPANFYSQAQKAPNGLIIGPWERQVDDKTVSVISVITPIHNGKTFIGVVGVDLQPRIVQKLMDNIALPLGDEGKLLIISASGTVAAARGAGALIGTDASTQIAPSISLTPAMNEGKSSQHLSGTDLVFVTPIELPEQYQRWVVYLQLPRGTVEADASRIHNKMMRDVTAVESRLASESESGLWKQVLFASVLLIYALFMMRLLTVLERQGAALKKSENRLQTILDNATAVIYMKDVEGRYVLINNQYEQLFHLTSSETHGKTDYDIFPADIAAAIKNNDDRVLTEGSPIEFEEQVPVEGQLRTYLSLKFPVRDNQEQIFGLCGISTDITDRKHAQEQVMQVNTRLEQRVIERTAELSESLQSLKRTQAAMIQQERMAALGDMVAGISHEVNTPLGNALTTVSVMSEQLGVISGHLEHGQIKRSSLEDFLELNHESLEILQTNLQRAAELINTFKQVSVDQAHDHLCDIHVKEYLEKVLRSLKPRLKKTAHQIHIECDPQLVLKGYPGAFSQIITNLIMNSLIHGFEHTSNGHIDLIFTQQGETLRFIYRDNGCGMSSEVLKHVYEPFLTTKRDHGGSGLGMHIVYSLITNTFAGHIDCQSEPGAGIEVDIRIPIALSATPPTMPPAH